MESHRSLLHGVETVLLNANVVTVDERRPAAHALAIHGGRFAAVGDADEIGRLAGPDTEVLDLEGRTVVPGFIDAHIHVLDSGIKHVQAVDCDLPSLQEVQHALSARAHVTPAGQWVRGFKFDDTKVRGNCLAPFPSVTYAYVR